MSQPKVSRRNFFRRAADGVAVGAVSSSAAGTGRSSPERAWTIVGINWESNDEFCYEAGEFVEPKLFFSREEADAECQRLCDAFFRESPQDFGVCWDAYGVDPDTATWNDLKEAGFPAPYSVQELQA